MKLRLALYWTFLFITFNVGAIFFHLCRYSNETLSWTVELSPVLVVMKVLFVSFVSIVFFVKSDVFKTSKKYKDFFLKNVVLMSPVALIPMGIYYLGDYKNHHNFINNFTMVIAVIWLALFIFCVFYLALMFFRRKQ